MSKAEDVNGRVVLSRRQLHTFSGKSLSLIERVLDGSALRVVFTNGQERVHPMDDVRAFAEGDASEGAYALIVCTKDVRMIAGTVDHNDDWWIIEDENGLTHFVQKSSDTEVVLLAGEASEPDDAGDGEALDDDTDDFDNVDGSDIEYSEGPEDEGELADDGDGDFATDEGDGDFAADDGLPDYGDTDDDGEPVAPVRKTGRRVSKPTPNRANSGRAAAAARNAKKPGAGKVGKQAAPARGKVATKPAGKKAAVPAKGGRDVWDNARKSGAGKKNTARRTGRF